MIDIPVAAAQLRLGTGPLDPTDEAILQHKIDAAIQRAADWLDRPLYQAGMMPATPPADAQEMTPAIENAVLILVALDYDQRHGNEDPAELGLPREVHSLLAPYRRFGAVI